MQALLQVFVGQHEWGNLLSLYTVHVVLWQSSDLCLWDFQLESELGIDLASQVFLSSLCE